MGQEAYAGDLNPASTWRELSGDPTACLIDVRTNAEWAYVGLPDLEPIGRQVLCISWKLFPDNAANAAFVDQVRAAGVAPGQRIFLICRSGQRSRDAAIALTASGFETCYNVAEGFEGDRDSAGHRGSVNGWKVAGLPWRQG